MAVKNDTSPTEKLKTAFTVLSIHFPDAEEKLKTVEFLKASSGIVILLEQFGKVFSPVVNDINGNIKKLWKKHDKDNQLYQNLEDMILSEQVEDKTYATNALLWLRRALHFLSIFFQCIIMDSECGRMSQDLTPFFKKAYSETLEPHHGWLGTQLFNVCTKMLYCFVSRVSNSLARGKSVHFLTW
ncbi:pleckstrin homology domain-containing family A member 8 isoform X2 [Euwallacea fornicatus]|uniref:pleckstrin homology domain-containing family A member 8 isoform X2 n=1 Tax=Euwallacea fornicatus TaxID=995702 RepID=UPI00338E60FA